MSSKNEGLIQALRPLLWLATGLFALFSLGRLLLFPSYYDRILESGVNGWGSFLYGLRMDSIVVSMLLVLPSLLLLASPRFASTVVNAVLRIYSLLVFLLALFLECATVPFFAEYDSRLNDMFINYLAYPQEIFGTIIATPKTEFVVTTILMSLAAVLLLRRTRTIFTRAFDVHLWKRLALLLPVLLILALGIRSSFGHRPANLSDAIQSSSHLVNEITKNSLHSLGYTIYAQAKYGADISRYGTMESEEAIRRVRSRLNILNTEQELPFMRVEPTHFPS